MRRRTELDPADVHRYGHREFLEEVFDYHPGEHVTILAPSGGGKTHLSYELLEVTARPELQAIVFVMKPRDETVERFTKRTGFRIVRQWPPTMRARLQSKPAGWALWPKTSYDPDVDDSRQYAIFRQAIQDSYRKGNRILFADETYSLENELPNGGLTKWLRMVHTKGRSMKCGIWSASQRPAHISMWAYQAHHLFLGNDPTDDAQKRLSEIGAAVDKLLVREVVGSLRQYEWLYIHRDSRTMCIVEP